MAEAIILSRVPSGPTTAELQIQFIGADLLANPTYAHVTVTVDYAAQNSAQPMAAFAAAVRTRSSTINKAGGGNGVTVPANSVLDFLSLNRG